MKKLKGAYRTISWLSGGMTAFVVCLALLNPGCGGGPPRTVSSGNSGAANNTQKNLPQAAGSPAPTTPAIEELKKFSPEELLEEVRARELNAINIDLPDLVLERHSEAMIHQDALNSIEHNPLLSGYSFQELVLALTEEQKAIYLLDDRKEVREILTDASLRKSAGAVVSLFHFSRIAPLPDGKNSKIVKKMYGTEFRLCDTERFYTQPCSAFCSGVLVAPDVVATAGHCIDTASKGTPPVKDIRFVFGYWIRDQENAELVVSNDEIYSGKLFKRVYTPSNQDWALVKLDKPVTNHEPVPIRRTAKISDTEDVYVIGHPCGLPAKFADGAIVRSNSDKDFFVANLDTYAGNSGSPVFNRHTHEVEGLLVRGEKDFIPLDPSASNSCQKSLVCPTTGCRGEDCIRTTIFAGLVP